MDGGSPSIKRVWPANAAPTRKKKKEHTHNAQHVMGRRIFFLPVSLDSVGDCVHHERIMSQDNK